jgi:dihydrolipoamide dehydrogenase
MPSKLLIAAADAAHHVHLSNHFGIVAGPARIDATTVFARVRSERDRFVGFVTEAVDAWPAEHRVTGHARCVAPGEIEIEGRGRLRAKSVVIATGSHVVVPDGRRQALGLLLLTSDDVFELERLPRALAVIGAGVIGLELGLALSGLGVAVKRFDRGRRFVGLTDPDVARAAREILGRELPIVGAKEVTAVARDDGQARIEWRDAAGSHSAPFDALLVAIARRSNLDGLDLERAGIARNPDGRLDVDPQTRTYLKKTPQDRLRSR